MDNYNSNGSNMADDIFAFVPPNMMLPENALQNDGFSCKEERERYLYHLEHDHELHLQDSKINPFSLK